MIRLYRALLEKLFVVLAYEKYANENDLKQVSSWVRERLEGGSDSSDKIMNRVGKQVHYIRNTSQAFHNPGTMEELLNDVLSLLEQASFKRGVSDGDLIDTIVNTLKLPYAGNVLSGSTLGYLRQALLLPDEVAQLRGRLESREMSCSACGHEFKHGEMATCNETPGSTGFTFVCAKCYAPEQRICNKCNRTVIMDKRLYKAIEKGGSCEVCQGTKKPEEVFDAHMDERVIVDEGRAFRGNRRPQFREPLERAARNIAARPAPIPRANAGLGAGPIQQLEPIEPAYRIPQPPPIWNAADFPIPGQAQATGENPAGQQREANRQAYDAYFGNAPALRAVIEPIYLDDPDRDAE